MKTADEKTVKVQLKSSTGPKGDSATLEIVGAESVPYGSKPTVTEEEGSTQSAKRYRLGIPEGKPGMSSEGAAKEEVDRHNVSGESHEDIRLLIEGLKNRLNALADSDDTTLDQMSEIVAYIKSNKSLIDAITTSKVSVGDIVDNLSTNVGNKPLSAAQGVVLKGMIDGVATQLNQENEKQNETLNELKEKNAAQDEALTQLNEAIDEQGEAIAGKANDKDLAAVAKSGSYDDLSNKPTIPTMLKNPNALVFKGAVSATYDGSAPVEVTIPAGGEGGGELNSEIICDITTTEPVARISCEVDDKPYRALYVYVKFQGKAGESNPEGIVPGYNQSLRVTLSDNKVVERGVSVSLVPNNGTPVWHNNFALSFTKDVVAVTVERNEQNRNNISAIKEASPIAFYDVENYTGIKKIEFWNTGRQNLYMTPGAQMKAWGLY